jgi:hypothetical protein
MSVVTKAPPVEDVIVTVPYKVSGVTTSVLWAVEVAISLWVAMITYLPSATAVASAASSHARFAAGMLVIGGPIATIPNTLHLDPISNDHVSPGYSPSEFE